MKFNQQQPIYLQIADHICEQILRKELCAGDKVTSIRDLAVFAEVNPNTVVNAYNYLEEKSIIQKERGLGFFITANAYTNTMHLKKDGFIKNYLPLFFKNMRLLNLSFKDLQKLYTKHTGDKS